MKVQLRKVSYGEFVNSIFNSLQPNEMHELFYCSLFDPSSWEELAEQQRELLDLQRVLEKRIIGLIKRKSRRFFRRYTTSERKEHFLASFVRNGDLCSFMLAAALKGKKIDIPFQSIGRQSFPDLIINTRGAPKAGIEIKRLIGCSNFKERIDDEVIPPLKDKKIDKLLLLLVFPVLKKDDPFRVHQLTGGYYVYEDYIRNKIQKEMEVRVLCRCVEEKYSKDSKYSFKNLIEDLLSSIPKPTTQSNKG